MLWILFGITLVVLTVCLCLIEERVEQINEIIKENPIDKGVNMFEKNKINQTYTNKPTTSIFCPTCDIPMLLCQYYGGGFYWVCGQCNCKVEKTGI